MRIPRFAFALMLVALLALSLSTGLFLTRAKGTDRWFQYEVSGRDGKWIMRGAVPRNGEGNSYYDADAGMTYPDGIVLFHVRFLERLGDEERIRARALWVPRGGHSRSSFQSLNDTPEREFLYSIGEDLKIPVDGYGNLTIKGHFAPTLPESVQGTLYPGDGKFRIDPPLVLVRENQMLGKYDGGGGELFFDKSYFAYGEQEEGWYVFSAKPIAGATEGTLTMNQIEFNIDGKQYLLLTGDPILFGRVRVWVKHYASIQEADPTKQSGGWQQNGTELAFGQLEHLVTEK